MIYIIEDNEIMANCIAAATGHDDCRIFNNAIDVLPEISDDAPDLIFLDILLTGPDGFTLLNELVSHEDTAKIPVVIISSLDFADKDLSSYGVVKTFNKDTMLPSEIKKVADYYTNKTTVTNFETALTNIENRDVEICLSDDRELGYAS